MWPSAAPPKTLQEIEAEALARAQPPRKILSMEEIEADMARVALQQQQQRQQAAQQQQAQNQAQFKSLAEIEREMMSATSPVPPQAPAAPAAAASPAPLPAQAAAPPPNAHAQQQALLDRMFPALGSAPTGQTPRFPDNATPSPAPPVDTRTPEEIARAERKLEIRNAKIQAMSKYNNIMLSGDKDFITRIQLSQLATTDPYITDFYAQVYSALMRSKAAAAAGQGSGPSVIQVAPGIGMGVGVGGQYSTAGGNRFGKLGTSAMQKLSTQVKRLVEGKKNRQENSGSTGAFLPSVS
jgi:DNA topoisomerase 2-associated protein PAT1